MKGRTGTLEVVCREKRGDEEGKVLNCREEIQRRESSVVCVWVVCS